MIRTISQQGLDLIKRFEGFSPEPYYCSAGKRTIGYGHVIKKGEDFCLPLTLDEANSILNQDVAYVVMLINRLADRELTQNQFDALVSFVFNVGGKAFENSTLLRLLRAGDDEKAAAQFARWVYAGGKKLPGLAARRAEEAQLFQS
jgi:lysozyme